MTGIEPRTSGIGSDCSTNWATTTALEKYCCATKISCYFFRNVFDIFTYLFSQQVSVQLAFFKYGIPDSFTVCLWCRFQIKCVQIWQNFATFKKVFGHFLSKYFVFGKIVNLLLSKYSYISCISIYLVIICSCIVT